MPAGGGRAPRSRVSEPDVGVCWTEGAGAGGRHPFHMHFPLRSQPLPRSTDHLLTRNESTGLLCLSSSRVFPQRECQLRGRGNRRLRSRKRLEHLGRTRDRTVRTKVWMEEQTDERTSDLSCDTTPESLPWSLMRFVKEKQPLRPGEMGKKNKKPHHSAEINSMPNSGLESPVVSRGPMKF